MAKKMPLDRLRQISRTRKPLPLDRPHPVQQGNEPVRALRRQFDESTEE